MKKAIVFFLFILSISFTYAQGDSISSRDTNYLPSKQENDKQYNLSMGASFGRGFFGENFTSSYIAPSAIFKVNKQSYLRVGVLSGDLTIRGNDDKTPYENRYKHNSAYVGMDIDINPKLMLSVTAFFDNYSPNGMRANFGTRNLYSYGFNANLSYELSKNSFLNLSVTVIESNNPYSLYTSNPLSMYSPMGMMHSPVNSINRGFYGGFGW